MAHDKRKLPLLGEIVFRSFQDVSAGFHEASDFIIFSFENGSYFENTSRSHPGKKAKNRKNFVDMRWVNE